jgi:hypothetical protein
MYSQTEVKLTAQVWGSHAMSNLKCQDEYHQASAAEFPLHSFHRRRAVRQSHRRWPSWCRSWALCNKASSEKSNKALLPQWNLWSSAHSVSLSLCRRYLTAVRSQYRCGRSAAVSLPCGRFDSACIRRHVLRRTFPGSFSSP